MAIGQHHVSRRLMLAGLAVVAAPAPGLAQTDLPPEIFLIPDTTLGDSAASGFAKLLARVSGLRVKSLLAMGLAGAGIAAEGQIDGEPLAALMQPVADRVRRLYQAPDATFILLTARDINSAAMGTNFLFSYHNRLTHLSVVSAARTVAARPDGSVDNDKTFHRVLKLLLRTVGEQALHMPRSSDPKSLMYSPLLSVDDLDMIEEKLGTGI